MNYNNFEELYINKDYSNIEKNILLAKLIGETKKHTYINVGLKYEVENQLIKRPINIIEKEKIFLEKKNSKIFNLKVFSNKKVTFIEKSPIKKYINSISLSNTKFTDNVLVGSSEGRLCLLLKRPIDKSLLISLKKRESFYLIKCKYLTKYNNWLLVVDEDSDILKILKAIITRKIYNSFNLKILKNLDKIKYE